MATRAGVLHNGLLIRKSEGKIMMRTDNTINSGNTQLESQILEGNTNENNTTQTARGELSRLGRNLFMIMEILNVCMTKECRVWTIKDNYRLGEDIQSKVLAFAFGLSAEIERNLISQRTKEALARKKAEGVVLGRPVGRKSSKVKLSGKEDTIRTLIDEGVSKCEIARVFKVNRMTVDSFIKTRM